MLSRNAFRSATLLSAQQPAAQLLPRALISIQTRNSSITATTKNEAQILLESQRKKRPIAPHLSIYQPQLTWYASAANRITGCMLAGYVYLFGAAYVVAPLAGMHIESASLAAGMAALPFAAKLAIKGMLAVPFAFHALNGVRHLIWDTGRQLTIDGVYRTGYVVLGLSSVSSIYLMFFA